MESIVKKLACSFFFFSALTLGSGTLFADADADILFQDFNSEQMLQSDDYFGGPFRVSVHGDWIQRSKIEKRKIHHQHVDFATVTAQVESTIYCNRECNEGVSLGVGYTAMHFDWNENPYFKVKEMGQVSFSVTGFSERLIGWKWQTQLTAYWEPKYKNFSDYTNYDIVLWGKRAYAKNLNLHIGFWAQTGMKLDHIYPIIGIDWLFCENWMLNLVFPLNMSLIYTIDQNWSAALAARVFNVRYRFGEHEHLKKALLDYRNGGLEFALNYNRDQFIANIHVGVTAGGRFRISDHDNKCKKRFTMDSAAYAGGEIAYKF